MSFIHRKYRQRTLTIVTQATQQEKNQIRDASCVPEMGTRQCRLSMLIQ